MIKLGYDNLIVKELNLNKKVDAALDISHQLVVSSFGGEGMSQEILQRLITKIEDIKMILTEDDPRSKMII